MSRYSALKNRPSCVLLDMDNTIYDYESTHGAAMQAVREQALNTLNISIDDFDRCYAQARVQTKNRLKNIASSHSRLLYFQRVLELAGLGSQPGHAIALQNTYWREFLNTVELFPEVEDFLDDLRIAGIPVVIVTDLTAAIQMRKFLFLDLGRFTDWLVTSEESGFDKPDRAIFELALAKLGGVEGSVWMIGDSYEKDIVGAKEAVNAITFQRKLSRSTKAGEATNMLFTKFSELRKVLQQAS